MPIYDFQCTSCGYKLELLRKISDASCTVCPKCNAETFNKLLSAPSFQLSGSGWYATDFKDKPAKNATSKPVADTPEASSSETAACKTGCACH